MQIIKFSVPTSTTPFVGVVDVPHGHSDRLRDRMLD